MRPQFFGFYWEPHNRRPHKMLLKLLIDTLGIASLESNKAAECRSDAKHSKHVVLTFWYLNNSLHLPLKRQKDGTNALFSFAMVKRNGLAEHVYTFLIISDAICIIRPNQTIHQGSPRSTTTIITSSRQNFWRKMTLVCNMYVVCNMIFCWTHVEESGEHFYGFKFACIKQRFAEVCSAKWEWHQQIVDASIAFTISYLFVCAPKWPICEVHPKAS